MASAWSLSVLLADTDAASAAGSGEAAGTTAPASPLSPLLSPANGLLTGAAQVVGGPVDNGAQAVGATPVGPVLTLVTPTVQSVHSSVPRSVPAVPPRLGVTPWTVGTTITTTTTTTTTTTIPDSPAGSPSRAGAADSTAGETVMSGGAGRHAGVTGHAPSTLSTPTGTPAQPAPKRPVPGVPTLFSLLATAGTTGSPSHGHGSSEGMPPVSALLPLLVGGLTPLGGRRHARWLFDARGPPPG